jgi:glycosyltransferase involved in cell wall biosynthesis
MHIAFDTWALSNRFQNTGIYVYAKKLLRTFSDSAFHRGVLIRPFVHGNGCNSFDVVDSRGVKPIVTGLMKYQEIWRLGGAALSARLNRADLVFCPTFNTLTVGSVPSVTTIHDVTPITMPTSPRALTYRTRMFMWSAAKFSKALITDSECSKRDLVDIYGVSPSKVSVVYLGVDREHFNLDKPAPDVVQALRNRFGISKPFIFHHGTVQPRKNLVRLMEAFQLMLQRNRNLEMQLILCGSFGWFSDSIRAFAKERGLSGSVVFTGPLSDGEVSALLKSAEMAVIPSLYEGFCLPMVEAMACGIPTIASRASCLPEISGGLLRYFDPESAEEIFSLMQGVLEDSALRQELVRKGIERASVFSWEQCAHKTLDALISAGA